MRSFAWWESRAIVPPAMIRLEIIYPISAHQVLFDSGPLLFYKCFHLKPIREKIWPKTSRKCTAPVMEDHFPDSLRIGFGDQELVYRRDRGKFPDEKTGELIEKGLRYGKTPARKLRSTNWWAEISRLAAAVLSIPETVGERHH